MFFPSIHCWFNLRNVPFFHRADRGVSVNTFERLKWHVLSRNWFRVPSDNSSLLQRICSYQRVNMGQADLAAPSCLSSSKVNIGVRPPSSMLMRPALDLFNSPLYFFCTNGDSTKPCQRQLPNMTFRGGLLPQSAYISCISTGIDHKSGSLWHLLPLLSCPPSPKEISCFSHGRAFRETLIF